MLLIDTLAFGITHLTDARYFAAWGVNYLAFPLEGQDPNAIAAIREWVEGPEIMIETGADAAAQAELPALREAGFTHLLTEVGANLPALRAQKWKVFLRVPVNGYDSVEDVAERIGSEADGVLLDFEAGGIGLHDLEEGSPFAGSAIRGIVGDRPCFLRIDLDGATAAGLEATTGINGVAVRGGSEEKVGYKSYDELDDLFETLSYDS